MADISLDDLIKKDRENKKRQPGNKTAFKNKKVNQKSIQPSHEGGKPQGKDRLQKNFKPRPKPEHQQRHQPVQVSNRRPVVNTEGRKLKILGLHPDVTNDELLKLFMEHGSLEKCRVDQDDFGRSMTTATVLFRSEDGARNAIQKLNKSKILNSVITVEYFRRERDENRSQPAVARTKPIHKNFKKRFDRR